MTDYILSDGATGTQLAYIAFSAVSSIPHVQTGITSGFSNSATSASTLNLSTYTSNRVMFIAIASLNPTTLRTVTSITCTPSLSFTKLASTSVSYSGNQGGVEVWWASRPLPTSAPDSVDINMSGATSLIMAE